MSARTAITTIFVALVVGLGFFVYKAVSLSSDLNQANQAITHLSNTIREERARYDQTDQMLAATARDRQWIEQEADALAEQLAAARSDNDCLNTPIPQSAALRLFRFRDRASGSTGTSPENLDGSATVTRPRPTYGEYIAAAEQFFQECNADRVSVKEWGNAE
ncbi:hypothetical protein [Marinobacterium lutimaris]|uniref:Uncharacterized protein n=1 Tax=Marinobacterium lutimaris TaxID=568106 RepID=A0A1H5Y9V2_9GAMM|nr:hypothetical protein [Marinobacterium lutimaris]SEG20754.1 hypothetical protein SAMN05444390_1011675 [Marinobacterium lutimaris]